MSRLKEFVQLTSALLDGGPVTFKGDYFSCDAAQLDERRHDLPILIGGNGPRLLALAAQHADPVSLTGFGATQSDGHTHAVKWSEACVAQSIALITTAAGTRNALPEPEVLVQHVELTQRREAAARTLIDAASVPGLDLDTALNTPFVLLGSPEQIAGQLKRWRQDHGIGRYVVRHDALDALSRIMRVLR